MNGSFQDEAERVDLSYRPKRRKSSVTAVASLDTWPGTVLRKEPIIMMVHYRLQGWVGSGVTNAQDGDTWPEIVRQSRVVDVWFQGRLARQVSRRFPR